ncbi:MAG: N-acetylmuramic acid 6-phosphate etherase [Bacteroidetes bacterium]|nr:MAG: N-acetylmuramic acid 6-phosphate etherase [Bacteroidota bacterium]REK07619.1 MAG: N-acetylmuramic acid 6-phosphate etherase [Bacteroidota bacterium]REK36949.1 MAG: N-acetylmuramic acid 6-phosphate etherase [Bacteroidota bacterium]REK47769.1 MAG: N-acetylmuramic acid 6-phosphate etherase [Bacteroidota bacterium]
MTEHITERESNYNDLDTMSVYDLLSAINQEDKSVPMSVSKVLHRIETVVILISEKMKQGGRLFYLGAGTSGRLGIVDASELPPTYGLEHGRVIALIAGGDNAIRKAVEFAEDNPEQGWTDLQGFNVSEKDVVIGIAASGSTPYVVGAMAKCKENNILCIGLTCNINTELAKNVHYPIEVIVGPEVVTGSTRMKAGTAQKLVLNMISTSVMVQLGRVKGSKMIDMQLTNNKLITRGTKMLMKELNITAIEAGELLNKFGSVRKALDSVQK